jgi:tetratricopeptide (TPR) repeat protein
MTYGGGAKPPAEIARELGVRYLLTGTVRFVGSGAARRVQVSPELVEVTGGAPPQSRWQQPFDAEVTDVFRVQSDIAGRVADAMQVALGGEGRARLAAVPTRNAAAYDAFLRGEAAGGALSAADPNALRRALGYYAQAVALDTGFAEAWAQRARTASLLYFNGGPTPALAREARTAADRALALAPEHPAGHLALGDFHTMVGGDQRRALAAYEAGRRLAPGNADLLAGVAFSEQWVGRSAEAVRDFRAAAALDPRSVATARRLGVALLWARRYPEARAASDRALALAPANPVMIQTRAMVELAEGDLAGARRVLAAAPPELDPDVLVAVMGNFWDVGWALDDAGQRRLLALRPAAFDGDRGAWGWVVAQTYAQRGDGARARAYADTARVALEAQLRAAPDDAQTRVIYGLVLAAVGRNADAVREAERGAALLPVSRDAFRGPYLQHQLARVYLLAGQPERALDTLEPLLRMPYYLSRAWLRIDPTFAPLRGDPRFERLAAER